MRYRHGILFDGVIVALSCVFILRYLSFVEKLPKETQGPGGQQQQVNQEVQRGPIHKDRILSWDPFRVKPPKKEVKPTVSRPKPPPKPAQPKPVVQAKVQATRLPLELHGVILDEGNTVAFIYLTAKRESGVFQVGEIVLEGVKLVEIKLHKVMLDNRGTIQELIEKGFNDDLAKLLSGTALSTASQSKSSPKKAKNKKFEVTTVGDSVFVTQKETRQQVKNLSGLLSQVRVQPNFTRSGRANGFKVLHVNRGSFIEALGLKSGDVIKAINGTVVDSMQKGYEIFNKLRSETSVDIEIIRDKTAKSIHFEMRY
jgi:type II secretory pathway component PulC